MISLTVAVPAVNVWETPSALYMLAGAVLYLVGTFLVTALGNVPLNNQLAKVAAADPVSIAVWAHYLDRRMVLNILRTVAAMTAAILLTAGLMQQGG